MCVCVYLHVCVCLSHTHKHTYTPSLSLSPSYAHKHTHNIVHTHSHAHTHAHTRTHTHTQRAHTHTHSSSGILQHGLSTYFVQVTHCQSTHISDVVWKAFNCVYACACTSIPRRTSAFWRIKSEMPGNSVPCHERDHSS